LSYTCVNTDRITELGAV